MPRPKVYENDRTQIQIRMTASLRRRLETQAQHRQVSKNLLIEMALEDAVAKWEKESGVTSTPAAKPTKTAAKKAAPVKTPARRTPRPNRSKVSA